MFRSVSSRVFALACLVLIAVGAALFAHYKDAYGIRLYAPNESWLHDQPWDYAKVYEVVSGHVQDSVFFVTSEAQVVALTYTLNPFSSASREPFEDGFEEGVRSKTGGQVGHCETVTTDAATWNCIEWIHVVKDVPMQQRAYLTGRGVTKVIVVFSTPDGNFSTFGSERRWLTDLEWKGPSVLYSI